MSEAYDRGLSFERKIEKFTRRKLGLDVRRDSMSGAGIHKADIRDRYNEMPIFIECKDQQTLKLKEWWRDADGKASVGQAPIVVFPMETEDLCIMRYGDLLNFIREIADVNAVNNDLRMPVAVSSSVQPPQGLHQIVENKIGRGDKVCGNGHLVDINGYCMVKKCKFSRGYKAPKGTQK